jgi:hypothetical protein
MRISWVIERESLPCQGWCWMFLKDGEPSQYINPWLSNCAFEHFSH